MTFSGAGRRSPFRPAPRSSAIRSTSRSRRIADLAIDLYLPGELGVAVAVDDAHGGVPDQLRLDDGQSRRRGGAAGRDDDDRRGSCCRAWRSVAPQPAAAIVAFGDSITDGTRSTADTNGRWPDHLARRLLAQRAARSAVLNAGIAGNRVLGGRAAGGHQRAGAVRPRRPDADRRHARGRHGGHQRHRQGAGEPVTERRRSDRRRTASSSRAPARAD